MLAYLEYFYHLYKGKIRVMRMLRGVSYVTNQRLSLETDDYTGISTGTGASHEPREHKF